MQLAHALDSRNVWDDATIEQWIRDTRFDDGDGNFVETSNPNSDWDASDLRTEADIDNDWRTAERTLVEITACYTDDHAVCAAVAEPYRATRLTPRRASQLNTSATCYSKAYFDLRSRTTFEALMNILKTLFVLMVHPPRSAAPGPHRPVPCCAPPPPSPRAPGSERGRHPVHSRC